MSMFGKDKAFIHSERFLQGGDNLNTQVPVVSQDYNDRIYRTPLQSDPFRHELLKSDKIEVTETIECTPYMWTHPMGLLRWFQMGMFFLLQWLVQITCGGDACTMIMNVFGYTAMGQLFVLLIILGLSIACGIILVAFVLNFHRAFPVVILSLEKVYSILGIVLMFIAGILGTWMAVLSNDPEVNYQGRGRGHIKGQWIAAAVIEFLMVIVYVFDFILQRRKNYPFTGKQFKSETQLDSNKIPTIESKLENNYYNNEMF